MWDFNSLLQTPLTPALREEDKQYVLEVSRPQGLNKEDLKIDVNERMLTISGEHKEERKDDASGKMSSSMVSFRRSMTLPENVDEGKISATMQQDGKLVVHMPKLEGMDKKRRIQIA
jgi:HSP20 family protein